MPETLAVRVRPAEPSEHDAVGELTVAAYEALGYPLGDYADSLRDVAGRAPSADVLVAESDGRVVGAVTYVPGPDSASAEFEDPDGAGIRFLAVASEAQGRGVGRRLLEACVERARAQGRGRIVLHTTEYMRTAQRMYESFGFVRDPARDLTVERGLRLLGYRYDLDKGPSA